jgi:hypothetical protein
MRPPTLAATIQRRILVNYRVDADVLASLLPPPFRPVVVSGYAVAGICLIRLSGVRPAGVPRALGVTTENAAHRVAVEWDTADGPVTGVYIPRRDTSSRLAVVLGGRAFPGWQHPARFRVDEGDGRYRIEVSSLDGEVDLAVTARRADQVMAGSVFGRVEEASAFFRCAPLGYAATPTEGVFDGVALTAEGWNIRPLYLDEARSSFFDDPTRFAPGDAVPDSAFLMANVDTIWRPQPPLRAGAGTPLLVGSDTRRSR